MPTPTPTPTPTPIPTPTSTATPSPTPRPSPSPAPSPRRGLHQRDQVGIFLCRRELGGLPERFIGSVFLADFCAKSRASEQREDLVGCAPKQLLGVSARAREVAGCFREHRG